LERICLNRIKIRRLKLNSFLLIGAFLAIILEAMVLFGLTQKIGYDHDNGNDPIGYLYWAWVIAVSVTFSWWWGAGMLLLVVLKTQAFKYYGIYPPSKAPQPNWISQTDSLLSILLICYFLWKGGLF
jgi:hypothetical protein